MDIHHLKIFFEACKEKSFTKAAKKLYISKKIGIDFRFTINREKF